MTLMPRREGYLRGGGRCRGVRGLAQYVCYMHMHTVVRELD